MSDFVVRLASDNGNSDEYTIIDVASMVEAIRVAMDSFRIQYPNTRYLSHVAADRIKLGGLVEGG